MSPATGPVALERGSLDLFSVVRSRKKYTEFLPKKVPDNMLQLIVEMAHSAPTGGGHDSRGFILVTDRNTLDELSKTHAHSTWLSKVPAAIVILGNPQKSRYWLEDSCIAGEHIWLAATALGLGASWAALYQSDNYAESQKREGYVKNLLRIPEAIRPVAILGLGYPSETQPSRSKSPKRDLDQVLHINRYRQE